MDTSIISYIGAMMLGACGFPELIRTIKDSKCHVGYGMLSLWYFGEILVFIHVFNTTKDPALLFNYGLNIAILSIMVYYKLRKG